MHGRSVHFYFNSLAAAFLVSKAPPQRIKILETQVKYRSRRLDILCVSAYRGTKVWWPRDFLPGQPTTKVLVKMDCCHGLAEVKGPREKRTWCLFAQRKQEETRYVFKSQVRLTFFLESGPYKLVSILSILAAGLPMGWQSFMAHLVQMVEKCYSLLPN
jgi:hypothetical protein